MQQMHNDLTVSKQDPEIAAPRIHSVDSTVSQRTPACDVTNAQQHASSSVRQRQAVPRHRAHTNVNLIQREQLKRKIELRWHVDAMLSGLLRQQSFDFTFKKWSTCGSDIVEASHFEN